MCRASRPLSAASRRARGRGARRGTVRAPPPRRRSLSALQGTAQADRPRRLAADQAPGGGAYLAGPSLSDALAAGDRAAARGYGVILGFWNADDEEPGDVARENLAAIEALAERGGRWYFSIKAPALRYSRELIAEIAPEGARTERSCTSTRTRRTPPTRRSRSRPSREVNDQVGITIPGRWARSLADADRACELGLRVRVTKGEWPDPDDPDRDMREGFLAVVGRVAGRACHVSVRDARTGSSRESPSSGSRRPALRATSSCSRGCRSSRSSRSRRPRGARCASMSPHGHASLRYGLAYLARNPRRVWWLARDLLLRRRRAPSSPSRTGTESPQRGPTETRSR